MLHGNQPTMKQSMLLWFVLAFFLNANAQTDKKMMTPPYLKKGDTVAIVATARKHIDDDLKLAKEFLENWGLKVVVGSSIGLDQNQLAGTDEDRAKDFQQQLDNPNVKAIWCVRGGYGTVRMVDLIDFTKFKAHPKWVIGFSDVTVLHSHIHNLGIQSIHGMMPVNIPRATPEAKESLRKALFWERLSYSLPFDSVNKLGKAKGEVVGGNLSILYSLFGSDSAINCSDKILFLEDLDEYLYHIDRMMMNLKRNGCLESLKGIVVGSMTKMKDNDIPWGKDALQIIQEVTQTYNIPVAYHFPAGHIPDNRALIFGRQATLEVMETGTKLIFD